MGLASAAQGPCRATFDAPPDTADQGGAGGGLGTGLIWTDCPTLVARLGAVYVWAAALTPAQVRGAQGSTKGRYLGFPTAAPTPTPTPAPTANPSYLPRAPTPLPSAPPTVQPTYLPAQLLPDAEALALELVRYAGPAPSAPLVAQGNSSAFFAPYPGTPGNTFAITAVVTLVNVHPVYSYKVRGNP